MGAYYQTFLSEPAFESVLEADGKLNLSAVEDLPKETVFVVHKYDFLKFLSCHFFANNQARATYQAIKDAGEKGLHIATLCDYDDLDEGLFVAYHPRSTNFLKIVEPKRSKDPVDFDKGFFVCDERKTYISWQFFAEQHQNIDKDSHKMVVSPIHLLTRKEAECMGGGDIDFDKEFETLDVSLVCSWYGKNIRFVEDEQALITLGYQNISEKVLLLED